jgi:hypothetical protein
MEILLPSDLESFNQSLFSKKTGFIVIPRSSDYTEWQYEDKGGKHVMFSPPLNNFLELLEPHFLEVESHHDSAFMVHLIAYGKL